MKLLEDRILQEGQVRPGNILKVDCFLNHQLDVELLSKIGEEFYRIFKDDGINKILTIEASGIGIACMAALLRTVWGLFYYQSAGPLLTYNALFVPVFLVAGLGCMVMSALFRQAAEMKAENDLTI